MTLLPIHIAGGAVAIVAGYVAIFSTKGMRVHRATGMAFVYAMTVMTSLGGVLALAGGDPTTALQALFAFYLAASGVLTVGARSRAVDVAMLATSIGIVGLYAGFGVLDALDPAWATFYSPVFYTIFGAIASIGLLGDVALVRGARERGAMRLARHLWRMSFALFFATGSFFMGQADELPASIRIYPLLAIPAFTPMLVMFYWLWKVRVRGWLAGARDGRAMRAVGVPAARVPVGAAGVPAVMTSARVGRTSPNMRSGAAGARRREEELR